MTLEASGLQLVAEIGLATILGESEDGLSIEELAAKTGVDGLKLGKASDTYMAHIYLTCCCSQSVLSAF